jgi:hypothetical protein
LHADNGLILSGRKVFSWVLGQDLQSVAYLPIDPEGFEWLWPRGPFALNGSLAAEAITYISDYEISGIQLTDMSDPVDPLVLGNTNGGCARNVVDVAIRPPLVLWTCSTGLKVWQLSDAKDLFVQLGEVELPSAKEVALADDYAFVLAESAGWSKLYAISLINNSNPTVLGSVDIPVSVGFIAQSQGFLFVATGSNEIRIFDVSITDRLRLFAIIYPVEHIRALEISNNWLYAATKEGSLLAIPALSPGSGDLTWLQ